MANAIGADHAVEALSASASGRKKTTTPTIVVIPMVRNNAISLFKECTVHSHWVGNWIVFGTEPLWVNSGLSVV